VRFVGPSVRFVGPSVRFVGPSVRFVGPFLIERKNIWKLNPAGRLTLRFGGAQVYYALSEMPLTASGKLLKGIRLPRHRRCPPRRNKQGIFHRFALSGAGERQKT
jgi:hypothetical protein